MSKYLAKDFLLEKIIIKGKYTSLTETPTKKGNFSSGYRQSTPISSKNQFDEKYDYKDDVNNELISNNINLRQIPKLQFRIDETFEYAKNIENILQKIKK